MALDVDEVSRRLVIERAGRRCEYCLVHEDSAGFPHHVDHIISRKHGGSSFIGNLAYACVLCNRYKGSDIASVDRSGNPVRFFGNAMRLSQMIRRHLVWENAVLVPLARRRLKAPDLPYLTEKMAMRRTAAGARA